MIIAQAEALITLSGEKVRFMNVELSRRLGYNTEKQKERLKYIRKKGSYKDYVARCIAQIQSQSTEGTTVEESNSVDSNSRETESDVGETRTWKTELKSWLVANSSAISALVSSDLTIVEDQVAINDAFEVWVKKRTGRGPDSKPKGGRPNGTRSKRTPSSLLSKGQRKRRRYRETMLLYGKRPGECVKRILEDREESPVESVDKETLHNFVT